MKKIFLFYFIIFSCFIGSLAHAQSPVQNIEQDDRILIKNFLDSLLLHHYIDSVTAKKAYNLVTTHTNEGYYDKYADNAINYLLQISHDIQSVLQDKHFEVFFASPVEKNNNQLKKKYIVNNWRKKSLNSYQSLQKTRSTSELPLQKHLKGWKNWGWFGKVWFYEHIDEAITHKIGYNAMGVPELKILEGNIGYIKIKHWINNKQLNIPIWAVAAHYLYNTQAIVLDIRDSGEGDVIAMIDFLRYFLPPSQNYLGSIYHKPTKTTQDFFNTKKHKLKPHKISKRNRRNFEDYVNRPLVDFSQLKGKNLRLLKQNLYILTDQKTISISEYFALLLRKHRKATIVGENTGGYGYITHHHQLWSGSLQVHVPETKISVLDTIHQKGLVADWQTTEPLETTWTKLVQQLADSTELSYTQSYLDGLLAYKKAQKTNFQLADNQQQNLIGEYKFSKKIVTTNNILYLEEFGERKKLTAIDSNLFVVDSFYENTKEINWFSVVSHYASTKLEPVYVRFDTNEAGKPALFLIYFGSTIGEFEKL